ncbi:glycerate kinase family protein [Dellaglioa sp. BT-FLS60]
MKLVSAIDSFKGSATSKELNEAVINHLLELKLIDEGISVPIADGGEGSMAAIFEACGGVWQSVKTVDLLARPMTADYLMTIINGEKTAVIESASVIGLDFIEPSEKTVEQSSSFGLGAMLKDALQQGVAKVIMTLGGSGTSDGGLGLLQAFGVQVTDDEAQLIITGNPLVRVSKMVFPDQLKNSMADVELIIAADVTNPFYGETGAVAVFGKQKGASKMQIKELDNQAKKVSEMIEKNTEINLQMQPGSGAAGGIGGALMVLGGHMAAGFPLISQAVALENKIETADLVITGEGSLDSQSAQGKVPFGVAMLGKKYHVPVVGLSGRRSADIGKMADLLAGAFSIQLGPIALEKAIEKTTTLQQIALTSESVVRLFKAGNVK